jgi:hypothetical protein
MNTVVIGCVLLTRREHIIALEPSTAGATRHAAAKTHCQLRSGADAAHRASA